VVASPFAARQAKTGGKGIRTPGLLIANETLYQLSYTPALASGTIVRRRFVSKRKDRPWRISIGLPTGDRGTKAVLFDAS
jgi:hypothetical protein